MAKTYNDYYNQARSILRKKTITKTDYDKFMAIPYKQFTEFQQATFFWLLEGIQTRIDEIDFTD